MKFNAFMFRFFCCSLLLFSSFAQSQTLEQSRDFIIANTYIVNIDCSRATFGSVTEYEDGSAFDITRARFNPREVNASAYEGQTTVYCLTGECISFLDEWECTSDDIDWCTAKAESMLNSGTEVTKTNSLNIRSMNVSPGRVRRAWEYLVTACGGAINPGF